VTYTPPAVYERRATVTSVWDADTLHIVASLGCDTQLAMTVRLYGLNAPELSTAEGKAAKTWVETWVADHAAAGFVLRTVRDKREKYGRWLADLLPLDGSDSLCQALLASGNAVPYMI
jgi:micrococcal nuclease